MSKKKTDKSKWIVVESKDKIFGSIENENFICIIDKVNSKITIKRQFGNKIEFYPICRYNKEKGWHVVLEEKTCM